MSILANKDTYVVIQGGVAGVNAARRMAEFCYLIKRSLNVLAFVYPPDAGKTNEIPYGSGLLAIPIYKTVAEATKHHPQINTSLVYIGADRAMKGGMEALDDPHIKVVSMITEGVPEKDAKILAVMRPSSGRSLTALRRSALSQPAPAGWVSSAARLITLSFRSSIAKVRSGSSPSQAASPTRSSGSARSLPTASRRPSGSAAMPIREPTTSAILKCSRTIHKRRRSSSSAKWAGISKSGQPSGTAQRQRR